MSSNFLGQNKISPKLIDKQNEMVSSNNELEKAKNNFDEWKDSFQGRKKEVEEKQEKLNAQRKYLQEFAEHHDGELEKSIKRQKEEEHKIIMIENRTRVLLEEEQFLKAQNDTLKDELRTLGQYSSYLKSVIIECPSFSTIDSILSRFQSISETNQEYFAKFQLLLSQFGSNSSKEAVILDTHKSYLIDRTMKFNEALNRVAQAKRLNEYKKAQVIKDIQRTKEKEIELATIKASLRAVYRRALERVGCFEEPSVKQEKLLSEKEMLEFIKNRYIDLTDVIRNARNLKDPSQTRNKE